MSGTSTKPKNIYKPDNSRHWYLRVKINGVTHRESLRTTSQRVAAKKAKSRIKELRGHAQAGDLDWSFSAGFFKFYDSLDDAGHSWSADTRKRYKTSLRQIARVLSDYCEDKSYE